MHGDISASALGTGRSFCINNWLIQLFFLEIDIDTDFDMDIVKPPRGCSHGGHPTTYPATRHAWTGMYELVLRYYWCGVAFCDPLSELRRWMWGAKKNLRLFCFVLFAFIFFVTVILGTRFALRLPCTGVLRACCENCGGLWPVLSCAWDSALIDLCLLFLVCCCHALPSFFFFFDCSLFHNGTNWGCAVGRCLGFQALFRALLYTAVCFLVACYDFFC